MAILECCKSDWFELVSLVTAVIGGAFALYQWTKSNMYKRGDIVESLIKAINDDPDIATIMDICDWNDGFIYNGKFTISRAASRSDLVGMDSEELFKKIDRTLAHFSYICYLNSKKALTKKEMVIFNYKIKRLAENIHIANYLFSLYHWSDSLGVQMSYIYLAEYCVKKGYLHKDFKERTSKYYKQMLLLADEREQISIQ